MAMEKSLFLLAALCFFTGRGLDITLDLKTQLVTGGRNVCGVLTCSEVAKLAVSSRSEGYQDDLNIFLHSITSLAVFKRSSNTSDNTQGKSDVKLGSVTSQNPRVLRVSNGRKVDGVLESERASLRLELVKRGDCQAFYTCQVRGVDSQGRAIIHSASLAQQPVEKAEQMYGQGTSSTGMSLQLGMFLQQLASQSVSNLEQSIKEALTSQTDKMGQLENRLEDKIHEVQKDLIETLEEKISDLRNKIVTKSDSFEHRLDSRIDLFENRVEDKIDNNNNFNKLMQLDLKVSTELSRFRAEAKQEVVNGLDIIGERLYSEQRDIVKNVSENFQKALANLSTLLTSMEGSLDQLKSDGEVNILIVKNNTESIRKLLTSGEAVAQCVLNETETDSVKNRPIPQTCERDMGKEANNSYPKYMMTPDFTLKRHVLCDTQTDGGGWVVIQRRTKGDVFFHRDWESYKAGFGNMDTDGDFWLGNQPIHVLTYVHPHELRVEIESNGKEYVALYKTFKLESESDNYRIRLGSVSSPLDNGSGNEGLSYHRDMPFSTFDRDNDRAPNTNCALTYKSGWWYKACHVSKLNAPWTDGRLKDAWYRSLAWVHATRTVMKIRALQ